MEILKKRQVLLKVQYFVMFDYCYELTTNLSLDTINDKAMNSIELFDITKCFTLTLISNGNFTWCNGFLLQYFKCFLKDTVSLGENNRCGVWGASCLTQSTGDTWNAKGKGRGVQTERAMGNTSQRSEVKILEEGQPNIELTNEDPTTRSIHHYSTENTTFVKLVFQKHLFY